MDTSYITQEGRKKVLEYKYKPNDESLISPLLQPYWEYCVTLLPWTMAPNVVTLIGFVAIIYHYLQTIYFCPNLTGYAPRWVFFVNAACIWWYQTLDAIDGKQARRTKSGSPLGELFDHGCDSLASMLQTVSLACALQLGGSFYTWIMVFGVHTIFYFSIWEQYYTDILRFSIIAGPTEALLLVILIHLITGVFGTAFWTIKLSSIISFLPNLQFGQIIAIIFFVMIFPALRENIQYVLKTELSAEDKALKGSYFISLAPYFIAMISWNIWMFAGKVNLFTQYPLLLCSIIGLVLGFCITRLVICRVCHQGASSYYLMIIPLPFLALLSVLNGYGIIPTLPNLALIVSYLIFVLSCYAHMGYVVINVLCDVLNIQAFTIKDIRLEQTQESK